jgi:hypothetical protein
MEEVELFFDTVFPDSTERDEAIREIGKALCDVERVYSKIENRIVTNSGGKATLRPRKKQSYFVLAEVLYWCMVRVAPSIELHDIGPEERPYTIALKDAKARSVKAKKGREKGIRGDSVVDYFARLEQKATRKSNGRVYILVNQILGKWEFMSSEQVDQERDKLERQIRTVISDIRNSAPEMPEVRSLKAIAKDHALHEGVFPRGTRKK